MNMTNLKQQTIKDIKLVSRDSFLLTLLFLPILASTAIRFIFPLLDIYIQVGINFAEYYILIVSFVFAMVMPSLIGLVTGFLLLDERDEGTLQVLSVSPLQPGKYLQNKLIMPVIVGIVVNFMAILISGIDLPNILLLLLVLILSSAFAPIFALLIATIAENKVEGFALMKILGIIFIVPLAAYFVSDPWQWLFGLTPVYWPVKLFWMVTTESFNPYQTLCVSVVSAIYNFALLKVLFMRFTNKKFI